MSMESRSTNADASFRSNVFAGSDIGYLKGISFMTKAFRNLNTVEKLSKKMGINCMCWEDEDEEAFYAGCRGGDIIHHNTKTGMSKFVLLDQDVQDDDLLKEICVHENNIITGFQNGSLYVHKIESEDSLVTTSQVEQLDTLTTSTSNIKKTLHCMDHNKSGTYSHMIATGGQENPLRIWDVNDLSADPIFTAKNIRNDWLDLRSPVWVTRAKFYADSNKVITGTGYGKVRMYDPSSTQRRPVIEVKCTELEEYPITALDVRTNSDYQVFVGNTIGTLLSIDLRKKSVVKAFKGNKGGVTDIKCHTKFPIFAVCSADRYVRCYDPDQKSSLLHSYYVNSSLNCILFSTQWERQDYGTMVEANNSDDKINTPTEKTTDDASDNDDEELWDKMEVVQTKSKKRKLK